MSDDRLDRLLEEALANGEPPREASAAEREEIERLLGAVGMVRQGARDVKFEAAASHPVARARFERFLAGSRPAVPSARGGGRWRIGHVSPFPRALALAAPILVALAVVGGMLLLFGEPFTGPESVLALADGDYVQLEGVVSESADSNGGRRVVIESEYGRFTVEVSDATGLVGSGEIPDPAALRSGDAIVVAGVVSPKGSIAASTLGVAARDTPRPQQVSLAELKALQPQLRGQVVFFQVKSGGERARVIIETEAGRRLLIEVDGVTVADLVQRLAGALGARVEVVDRDARSGLFRLGVEPPPAAPPAAPPGDPGARPALISARGVILVASAEGILVRTADGRVTVRLQPATRVLPGTSGLTREEIARGAALAGYTVAVAGGTDAATGAILADVIVLGPRVIDGSR